ncbi:MAG: DUF4469 domain-containing protein [Treponema sp.]|jgi:hypothetical protein|nr:DUF4469 domain-containing protein [Treponema sp.]
MAIGFTYKDILHKIVVRFAPATLPGAKKPYVLRPARRPVLDIHALAGKAEIFNIHTAPKVIEEGLSTAIELIFYHLADGYTIKTPLGTLNVYVGGEYDGTETCLPGGVSPKVHFQASEELNAYLVDRAEILFDGFASNEGCIGTVWDETTGRENEVMSIGGMITIHGQGIKIKADEVHQDKAGLYFTPVDGNPVKARQIAVNEPRTLKVLVPPDLPEGKVYRIELMTQAVVKGHSQLHKDLRYVQSEFFITAQKATFP